MAISKELGKEDSSLSLCGALGTLYPLLSNLAPITRWWTGAVFRPACLRPDGAQRASIIDPYLPSIETWQFQAHGRTTVHAMQQQRGYPGGSSHFRSHIAQLCPRRAKPIFGQNLPGEQAQVDWGI